MTENERLTHECGSGIRLGYWTNHKKDELVERLAAYEDLMLSPYEVKYLVAMLHADYTAPEIAAQADTFRTTGGHVWSCNS